MADPDVSHREIRAVQLDKLRPAVLLTREAELPYFRGITVAPITSTIVSKISEVSVGVRNGLDHDSVINCDDITTVPYTAIGEFLGWLDADQEFALTAAVSAAFGLWALPSARPGRR